MICLFQIVRMNYQIVIVNKVILKWDQIFKFKKIMQILSNNKDNHLHHPHQIMTVKQGQICKRINKKLNQKEYYNHLPHQEQIHRKRYKN